ncbi:MAG: hypothetical protein J5728_01545 [Lachnospiraceae bacterium]|nr:hypothetical protein [Lachnospiraceae bacterium]
MDKDIRKNIVDESGKNSDNIVDIEAFAAEYEADAEFENLIKNGLDESWDDLGLSVSDDLIARTMDAIKNADASAKAFPAEEKPAQAPAQVKAKKFNYRRIARIAAGIAAAALIGIVGIGVLKNGLFMKKSADATMAPNSNGSSSPVNSNMAAADTKTKDSSYNKSEAPMAAANSTDADESYAVGSQIIQGLTSENGYYIADSSYTAVADDDQYDGEPVDFPEADASCEETAATDAFTGDLLPTSAILDREGMKSSEITEGIDMTGDLATGTLDITSFGFESDEQYNTVKNYIESVRGEFLGTGADSDYIADENALLYRAAWPETDAGSLGLLTICDIYGDHMVCTQSSFLSHIEPSHEFEEYALEDGEAVAKELKRLFGDEE